MNETDIREQLAAHLAGELDEPAASALQARIESEPWIGRLADEMADMLVLLGRADQVAPPPGFADRLRAGLESQIGHPLADPAPDQRVLASSGAAAATGWSDAGRPRARQDGRRPGGGRQRGRDRLRGALGVAAVIAVLAVAGVGVLAGGGMFSDEDSDESAFSGDDTADVTLEAAEDAADGGDPAREAEPFAAAEEATEEDEAAATGAAEGAVTAADAADEPLLQDDDASGGADVEAPAAASTEEAVEAEEDAAADATRPTSPSGSGVAGDGPAVLDLGAIADDDGAIGVAVGDHDAVDVVLGTPAAEATERAGLYRDELLRGEGFADGTDPAACLADTLDAAGPDLVPAVAARIDLPDGPAVAYALVRSAGRDVLDTVDVWVLDLPGCAVDRVVQAVR